MVPNDLFAILNTDEKGFFKLAQYAISQMQGRQPTSVVFGQNTLPWLAFKHNFMTEPERVGDARARSALVNSNVAMRNVVAELGLAVYQDRIPSVNNLSGKQLDLLSTNVSIGSFMVADATHEIRKPSGVLDVNAMLTIGFRDMSIDAVAHIGPEKFIRYSMRFDHSLEVRK